MTWIDDNKRPLMAVGAILGVAWFGGRYFDKNQSFNAEESSKKAETFEAKGGFDRNCKVCKGTGWMPKKGDPKGAKTAKSLGLSIDELTMQPCNAGGKDMGCFNAETFDAERIQYNYVVHREPKGSSKGGWFKSKKAETFDAELEDEPRAIILYDIVWKTNKDLPEKVYISAFDEETLEGHRDEDIQDYLYERFNDYAHSYKMQHEGGNYTPDVFTDMKRFPEEYGAETFEAEKSYQEKIPPFTDKDIWNQGFYSQKVYPLGNEYQPQKLLTPIENGIPLRESGSIFNFPKVNYDSVKGIQITWGELLKIGKLEVIDNLIHLGGSRYGWKTMKTVFKKLPKNTVMQIKAFENVPCVITFTYEGQEWYYTQAPYLDYWERDEIREKYTAETFEAKGDCAECYGTGGLYDSHMGINDECHSCGGTGFDY